MQAHLVALAASILLPLVLAAAGLLWWYAHTERDRYQQDALVLARELARGVDREIDGIILALQALATSPALADGDLATFDAQARELLRFRGRDISLRDRTGQQLVNTRVPWGTPLPRTKAPQVIEADGRVFADARAYVSDLYIGTVAGQPLLLVNVPVKQRDKPVQALNMTLTPAGLSEMLRRALPSPDWVASIVDRKGLILARSRDLDRFVGTTATEDLRRNAVAAEGVWVGTTADGTPVLAAYARSALSGWRVAVGVPLALVEAPLQRLLAFLALGAFLVLSLASLLAVWWGRRLARAVEQLAEAGTALGRGDLVAAAATPVREVNRVGEALTAASLELHERARRRDEVEAELRGSQERLRMLLGELNHRVKNTLAVIQAIARRTAGHAGSLPQFTETFLGRIRALAAAQELLTETGWAGASFEALVRRSLAPYVADRQASIAVARVVVPAQLAQDLALALHELATNAVKHGALSTATGRVSVAAGLRDLGDGPGLWLDWREQGGPPAVEPQGSGFGMTLLTQVLVHGHGGKVELGWEQEGLVCRIAVPLRRAAQAGDARAA